MERRTRLFAARWNAHCARRVAFLLVIASCAFATGCAEHRRACMPKGLLAPETTIDLDSAGENDHTRDRELLSASLARLKVATKAAVTTQMTEDLDACCPNLPFSDPAN